MAKEAISFSPREMEVLALAWQCMENEPKVNFKRLADLAGYTEASASVTFGKIKRKLKQHAETLDGDSGGTPKKVTSSTPAGTPKPKAKPQATPNDKARATPKSTSKRATSFNEGSTALDGSPLKKKMKKGKGRVEDEDDEFATVNVKIKKDERDTLQQDADEYLMQGYGGIGFMGEGF